MSRKSAWALRCTMIFSSLVGVYAQKAEQDSASIQKHLKDAEKIAGTMWAKEANFFCSTEEQVAAMHILPSATQNDSPESRRAEPTKVFDNLYFVGTKEVTTWVITTPDGYIMIDSGYAGEEEKTMIPGMVKLGLDPAKIKYVLITHGHSDHFGGALYLQKHYGAHVYMSAPDWDFIVPKPDTKKKGGDTLASQPNRDLVAVDGEPIVLGGVKVTPVFIPGHTPGAMGFVFPVSDNGKPFVAGLFGGTILNPQQRFPVSLFEQYLRSIKHFQDVAKKMNVDVELENHPIMDGTFDKLAALKARKPTQQNPFVVGKGEVRRFIEVMVECTEVQIVRHGGRV
jgi:metallo-beta-lactamase class B